MYFYGSVQSSAWTTYGKKSVILAKILPQGNVNWLKSFAKEEQGEYDKRATAGASG